MIWFVVIYLPILVGLLTWVPSLRPKMTAIAPWMALPALIVALWPRVPEASSVEWLLLGSDFGLTQVTRVFLVLTALLWLLAGIYGHTYMAGDPAGGRFWFFFNLTLGGNLGLILTEDVASFYFYFALMTFAGYGLIVHNWTREAFRAGKIYIVMAVVGEAALLAGLLLASYEATSLRIDTVVPGIADSPSRVLIAVLLVSGFGIKAGVIPLHLWLPLAHPVAPTPASAVLSGAMIKAGLLGWLQFLPLGEVPMQAFGAFFLVVAFGSAFLAALFGVFQKNPKAVLAYSSISQMGIISTGVGVAMIAPETWRQMVPAIAFYALHHGLAKGALFLGVGVVQADMQQARQRKLAWAALLLPALALAGAPLTSGAAAKNALKEPLGIVSGQWEQWLTWLLLLAATGTTVLMVRFLWLLRPKAVEGDPDHPIAPGIWAPWAVLIAASTLSAWIVPWYLNVEAVQPVHLAVPYVWQGAWPILLGLILGWAVISLRKRGYGQRLKSVPAGDMLVLLEPVVDRVLAHLRKGAFWIFGWGERQMASVGDRFDVYAVISGEFDQAEKGLVRFRAVGIFFVGLMILVIVMVWRG